MFAANTLMDKSVQYSHRPNSCSQPFSQRATSSIVMPLVFGSTPLCKLPGVLMRWCPLPRIYIPTLRTRATSSSLCPSLCLLTDNTPVNLRIGFTTFASKFSRDSPSPLYEGDGIREHVLASGGEWVDLGTRPHIPTCIGTGCPGL